MANKLQPAPHTVNENTNALWSRTNWKYKGVRVWERPTDNMFNLHSVGHPAAGGKRFYSWNIDRIPNFI